MTIFGKRADEAPSSPPPPAPARKSYGIDDVRRLLESLPLAEHEGLVVSVVKSTLESMNVRLSDLFAEAAEKERSFEQRIQVLRDCIAELEAQVSARQMEIARIEEELSEVTGVKHRLTLAEAGGEDSRALAAARSTHPMSPSESELAAAEQSTKTELPPSRPATFPPPLPPYTRASSARLDPPPLSRSRAS